MTFPIDQFEQHIEERILGRGLSYFKKGLVKFVEETAPGEWEAAVEGSEADDYEVSVRISNGSVQEHSCDCPYDHGPVCKHVTAVLFHIQQEQLGIVTPSSEEKMNRKEAGTKSPRPKSLKARAAEVLDGLTHEEALGLLRRLAESDAGFRNVLLTEFAHKVEGMGKDDFAKQLKDELNRIGDRDGFIGYREAGEAYDAAAGLLENARKLIGSGKSGAALPICQAVAEVMAGAMQYADDSYGDIGSAVEEALTLLSEIAASKTLSADEETALFNYCLAEFKSRRFSGFDWHYDFLAIACTLTEDKERADTVRVAAERAGGSDWEQESVQRILVGLIHNIEGEPAAMAYMRMNVRNSHFRDQLIDRAISSGDFAQASDLAEQGIRDDADKRGLVSDWENRLLDIAIAKGDISETLSRTRTLYLEGSRSKRNLYKLMKQYVPAAEWDAFVRLLATDLLTQKGWHVKEQFAEMCIQEGWLDRLLAMVKENPTYNYIEKYEKHLAKNFSEELSDLYVGAVLRTMSSTYNMGRNHYQEACRYLRRVMKLGQREKAIKAADTLRELYPRRKAMLEELGRL